MRYNLEIYLENKLIKTVLCNENVKNQFIFAICHKYCTKIFSSTIESEQNAQNVIEVEGIACILINTYYKKLRPLLADSQVTTSIR